MPEALSKEDCTKRLKAMLSRIDDKGDGCLTQPQITELLLALGLPKGTVEIVVSGARSSDVGRIDINGFIDWLFDVAHDVAQGPTGGTGFRPLFICTLNFLGNAYNCVEFMTGDETFLQNYKKLRDAFGEIQTADVMEEAKKLGFSISETLASKTPFEKNLDKEFLKKDNKVEMQVRTNMITFGMAPVTGPPNYHNLAKWRDLMKTQVDQYNSEPELAVWDIACNMAAEKAQEAFEVLCKASYLDPDMMATNVQTLLSQLPTQQGREIFCAVQEFPEDGTPKYRALLEELGKRGLRHVKAQGVNSSVGFIISSFTKEPEAKQSPLGHDPDNVIQTIGWPDPVDDKDKASLTTLCRKTIVLDIEATSQRPAIRCICAHSKEFKSDEGTRMMAKYLFHVAGNPEERAAFVMIDANTPNMGKSEVFAQAAKDLGFNVLSFPGPYVTTRKERSELHGQFYDRKKCLQVVEAHKTFLMVLQSASAPVWVPPEKAEAYPDLPGDKTHLLPDSRWPTDHCMVRASISLKQ